MTPHSLFYTGSTTKAFTAGAFSFLVEDNEKYPDVQWTTPIADVIRDDFVLEDEYSTAHVTFEDAFSHRTGMPRHDWSYGHGNGTAKEIVRNMRYLPLTAPLRTVWQYCNIMYAVVGYVIENLTGQWLGDVLRERIWEPLDMTETFFSLESALNSSVGKKYLSQGFVWNNATGSYDDVEYLDPRGLDGAGGIISNVLDYSKWLRSMMYQSPPLSPTAHKIITASHMILGDVGDGKTTPFTNVVTYGFGWDRQVYKDELIIEHNGGLVGYGTLAMFLPGRQMAIAMMGNTGVTSNFAQEVLAYELIDGFLEVDKQSRWDWMEISDKGLQSLTTKSQTAPARLFPGGTIPDPPLTPALDLAAYAGTYTHPAYGSIHLSLRPLAAPGEAYSNSTASDYLFADMDDRTWHVYLNLTHVSGEHWLVEGGFYPFELGALEKGWGKAEFRTDYTGKVTRLGMNFEGGNALTRAGELLFFERAA